MFLVQFFNYKNSNPTNYVLLKINRFERGEECTSAHMERQRIAINGVIVGQIENI